MENMAEGGTDASFTNGGSACCLGVIFVKDFSEQLSLFGSYTEVPFKLKGVMSSSSLDVSLFSPLLLLLLSEALSPKFFLYTFLSDLLGK